MILGVLWECCVSFPPRISVQWCQPHPAHPCFPSMDIRVAYRGSMHTPSTQVHCGPAVRHPRSGQWVPPAFLRLGSLPWRRQQVWRWRWPQKDIYIKNDGQQGLGSRGARVLLQLHARSVAIRLLWFNIAIVREARSSAGVVPGCRM